MKLLVRESKQVKQILGASLVAFISFLPLAMLAQDAPEGGFVLEPGRIEVFLDPGETQTRSISVINQSDRSVTYAVEFEDMRGSDDPRQAVILLGDARGPYSLVNYVSVTDTEFTLGPGEEKTIPVTISIPSDSEPGGHYGAVIVTNRPTVLSEVSDTRTGATIVSRLGALFFVRVNGEANESGLVEEFQMKNGRFFYGDGPYAFEILFRNSGNVHLAPYGYISLKNMFGREIATIPVDAYFSLPQSLRLREVEWGDRTLFGLYSAELELNRGYNDLIDTQTARFIAVPWKILAIALAVILVIATLFYVLLTRFEIRKKS